MVDYDSAFEDAILEEVSKENLMAHTEAIASWVRLSGERGEREALRYVEDVLRGFGYRTELILHPAFISIPGKASLAVLGQPDLREECITHAFGASTGPEGVVGRLAEFSGGKDIEGCIVLIDGMGLPPAVSASEAAGAIGQIFVSDEVFRESTTSALWGPPTPETMSLMPNTPGVTVTRQTGSILRKMLSRGEVTVRLCAHVDTGWREIPLLTADLEAGDGRFLLMSGHIDSWHYGAMDNGSANAAALEVARLMADRKRGLRRGLRLAFWSGHSHGRYAGSTWYCDNHWDELMERCVGHINLDSLGGKGATVVDELAVMPQSADLAAGSLKKVTGLSLEEKRLGRYGDQSFYGIGLTCAYSTLSEQPMDPANPPFLSTGGKKGGGLGWWWHTKYDTVDKLDAELLARDTRIYASTVYRVLSSRYLPYDFRRLSRHILKEVSAIEDEVRERLDLVPVKRRLAELGELLDAFYSRVERAEIEPSLADETTLRLSSALVPIAFREGERTDTDPYGPMPRIPMLGHTAALLTAEGESLRLIRTVYVRRRNRVLIQLFDAICALGSARSKSREVSCAAPHECDQRQQ